MSQAGVNAVNGLDPLVASRLSELGFHTAPAGTYATRQQGLGHDVYQGSQSTKNKLIWKAFDAEKVGTFIAVLGNSATSFLGGTVNSVKKLFWNEEEGFLRAAKTIGTLAVGGVAIAAGMAFAPLITGAALTGLGLVGGVVGGVHFVKGGLGWLGNVAKGDYDKALNSAHDAGEGLAEAGLSAAGARQAANALASAHGVELTAQRSFANIWQTFLDFKNTIGHRNFVRSSIDQLSSNVRTILADSKMAAYDTDGSISNLMTSIRENRGSQTIRVNNQEFLVDTNLPAGASLRNFGNRDELLFRGISKGKDDSLLLMVEHRTPGNLSALERSARLPQSHYYQFKAKDVAANDLLASRKAGYVNGAAADKVVLENVGRDYIGLGHNGQKSDIPGVGFVENILGSTRRVINNGVDYVRSIAEPFTGLSAEALAARAMRADGGEISARVLTGEQISAQQFMAQSRVPHPELSAGPIDRISGLVRVISERLYNGKNVATLNTARQNEAAITYGGVHVGNARFASIDEANAARALLSKQLGRNLAETTDVYCLPQTGGSVYRVVLAERDAAGVLQRQHQIEMMASDELLQMNNNNITSLLKNAVSQQEVQITGATPAQQALQQGLNYLTRRSTGNRAVYNVLTSDPAHVGRAGVIPLTGPDLNLNNQCQAAMQQLSQLNQTMFASESNIVSSVTTPLVAAPLAANWQDMFDFTPPNAASSNVEGTHNPFQKH